MESVLSLQSITSVEVGHKATPPDKWKLGIMFRLIVFTPAHACRLIPKDVELVNRAEFAKEFTKFLLEERYIEKGRGGGQEGGNKLMWKQPQRTSSIVLGTWPTNILMASGSGPLSFVPFLIRCPFPIPSITIITWHLFSKTRALPSLSVTLSESVRF